MLTLNQSKARLYIRNVSHLSVNLSCFAKPLFDAEWQTWPPLIFTCPLQSRGPSLCQSLNHSNPAPHSARVNKQTNKHLEQFRSRWTSGAPAFKEVPNLQAICQNNIFCLSGPNSARLFKTGVLTDGSLGSWWTLSDGFCQINGAEAVLFGRPTRQFSDCKIYWW